MKSLELALKSAPLVYVTRDLERARGLSSQTSNYYIITNRASTTKRDEAHDQNILSISEKAKLDTHKLLKHPKTISFLAGLTNPRLLVFKNTTAIEKICREHRWTLLNPPAELANIVEEKISQITWLGELKEMLPLHRVTICQELTWTGVPYIIQFNRAHTGSGTILVENKNQIIILRNTFPRREVRVTKFISGPVFTNNVVVWGKNILSGPLNYQITGLTPFTKLPFATVGNDWELPRKTLTKKQLKDFETMTIKVGKRLAAAGWKGLFGLDMVVEEKTGKIYLLEVNARQPASTTYESQLQSQNRPKNIITTFEAHLAALLDLPYKNEKIISLKTGSQIIQRVTADVTSITKDTLKKLTKLQAGYILYQNNISGADLLRIQLKKGIMMGHSIFNALGIEIAYACDPNKQNHSELCVGGKTN